eukprot:m.262561 g.262561  ORF g.262561 m.262561 type:complete len:122 (-) comp11048_c0_seq6:5878-6243(-)
MPLPREPVAALLRAVMAHNGRKMFAALAQVAMLHEGQDAVLERLARGRVQLELAGVVQAEQGVPQSGFRARRRGSEQRGPLHARAGPGEQGKVGQVPGRAAEVVAHKIRGRHPEYRPGRKK